MMPFSPRTKWAIGQMRYFQQKEEQARKAVSDRHDEVMAGLRVAYERSGRETFGALDETLTRRANNDSQRNVMIGDEQYYRSLTDFYAKIAQVELAIDEAHEREQARFGVRQAGSSRIGEAV